MSKKEELEAVVTEEASEEKAAEETVTEEAAEATEEVCEKDAPSENTDEADESESAAENDEEAAKNEDASKNAEEAAAASDPVAEEVDALVENTPEDESEAPVESTKKKAFPLQIPVLISLGIVVLALIGYFIYSSFFLHLPENIIWATEEDGVTYYYEFNDDNIFMSTVGSVEQTLEYEKITVNGEDVLRLYDPNGTVDIHYSITGSRIRKDQVMTVTYGDDTEAAVFRQVSEKVNPLELPTEFTPDQALLGEWLFTYDGTDYQLFINDDGSIRYQLTATSVDQYNRTHAYSKAFDGTYTITDGVMNWTIALPVYNEESGQYEIKPDVTLENYQLEGDSLTFLRIPFTRVVPATPDEQ